MPSRKSTSTALADKLDKLGVAPDEIASVIRRPVDEVSDWYSGDAEPDADALVLLRFLDDDADALRRVEQLRHTFTRTWEGDNAAQSTATETVGPAVRDGERYRAGA